MENPDEVKHETVMDTGAEQLGKTYAQALLGAAEKAGITDKIVDQLSRLVDEYLGKSPQLAAAFSSPRIEEDEKNRIIEKIFGGEFDPLLLTFLKVMASRGRLGHVSAVRDGALALYDEMSGQVLAKVRTAVPLDDGLRASITQKLATATGLKVRLQESVDKDLIGGMVIRIGDTVYDNSVANRLDGIAKRAKEGFSSRLAEKFDQLTQ